MGSWPPAHMISRSGCRPLRPHRSPSCVGPERQGEFIVFGRALSSLPCGLRCQGKRTEKLTGSVKSEGGLIRAFNSWGWNSILNFPAVAVKREALDSRFSLILLSYIFYWAIFPPVTKATKCREKNRCKVFCFFSIAPSKPFIKYIGYSTG